MISIELAAVCVTRPITGHIWHVHSHLVCSIASVLQWTVLYAVVYTVYYCTALNTVLITGHIWHVNSHLVCCTLHILCILKTAPHTIQKCTYATSYSSLHCIYTKQWTHTVAFEFCSTLCGRSSLWEAISPTKLNELLHTVHRTSRVEFPSGAHISSSLLYLRSRCWYGVEPGGYHLLSH